jgi:membrane fusion protein (multidrug efflux system)
MNKKLVFRVILGAVILVAGIYIFNIVRFMLTHEDTENAYLETDITTISPKIQGYITSVRVKENQEVKAGDTLFVLDNREYLLRVMQAEAALQNAEANVKSIAANATAAGANTITAEANTQSSEAQMDVSSASVRTAEANVEGAKARAWQAAQDFKRYEILVKQNAVTQQQFDVAKSNKENTEAAYQASLAQLDAAKKQVEVNRRQTTAGQRQKSATASQADAANRNVSLAQTLVAQRRVELETAQLNLSYTVIVAPSHGVIAKKAGQTGQFVNIGSPLCSLVSNTGLWATANFKETQVAGMKAGQHVDVKVDAYGGKLFNGAIESIAPATGAKFSLLPPDNASGNFVKVVQRIPVRIALTDTPDPAFPLRAGMSVEVIVPN